MEKLSSVKLLANNLLERSSIVANSTMNRERNCLGSNSYEKELSLNAIQFLQSRLLNQQNNSSPCDINWPDINWLDLCCGTGRALIEAAQQFKNMQLSDGINIVGIDLVGMFDRVMVELPMLKLLTASLHQWQPQQQFDLITCVHGLHYIGDKLELIERACRWLKDDGIFITNIDLANFCSSQGNIAKKLIHRFKSVGLEYQGRKRLLICQGKKEINFKFKYLGADDNAGPNYTGQPAINSYYDI